MPAELSLAWLAGIGVAAVAIGLPAIVRAWRAARRPETFRADLAANDPER